MAGARGALDLLARLDRDAYLATLLAPEGTRDDLASLHCFAAETAAIPLKVREPMAGMVRLQWWRDALEAGAATGNPVIDALIQTISQRTLPLDPFIRHLEARSFDLYDDPMPRRTQLEGYLGETRSTIIQLSCLILDPEGAQEVADSAGHAGCAQGLAEILQMLAAGRGAAFVPAEVAQAAGAERGAASSAKLAGLAAPLVALGEEHLGQVGRIPPPYRAAFAKPALARPLLRKISRRLDRLTEAPLELSPLARQWTIMRAGLTGRI